MIRAVPEVALCGFVLVATRRTTIVLNGRHTSGSGLSTVATSDRAVTERAPVRHFTVDRTRMVVAGTVLKHMRAGLATIHLSLPSNVALTTLVTPTASFGARRPFLKVCNPAVDRTVLSLTLARFLQWRAFLAFEHGLCGNFTLAGLFSSTTALGTTIPILPVTHDAVYGAWRNVALTNLFQERAHTVCFLVLDGPTAVHVPKLIGVVDRIGACLVACTPIAPLSNFTVNSAWPGVTCSRIFQFWAFLALCNRVGHDNPGTVLAARAAFLIAQVKSAPTRDLAVYRAHIRVALGGLL
jgi:hypothetical protein